jgi:hypothetical protein
MKIDNDCYWCKGHHPSYKCPNKTTGNKSASVAGLDAHALKKQLDSLLCVVNAVTCPHRHGQPVRPKDLTRLANRQLDVEEALRAMGN